MANNDGNYKTTTKKRRPRAVKGTPLKVGSSKSSGKDGYIKPWMNRNF